MSNLTKHLKIVRTHRRYVRKMCFKMGLGLQGVFHDLSKYSLTELKIAKYYIGTKSPHDVARTELGYSPVWYHHRNKNKHHWEYWVDSLEKCTSVKMPYKYVIELFCDMVSASKAYKKDQFKMSSPKEYFDNNCPALHKFMNKETLELVEFLFNMYSVKKWSSEKYFFKWYKKNKKDIKKKYIKRIGKYEEWII